MIRHRDRTAKVTLIYGYLGGNSLTLRLHHQNDALRGTRPRKIS